MKILIPIKYERELYHANLFYAPYFAVYQIEHTSRHAYYSLDKYIENPYGKNRLQAKTSSSSSGICNPAYCTAGHIEEHYRLAEKLKGYDLIVANYFCTNMTKAFLKSGLQIYKVNPFLQTADVAIKNFILGVSYASTPRHIHAKT